MRTTIVLVLLATLLGCASGPLSVPASEGMGLGDNDAVLYGDNYVFAVARPQGWTVDAESAKDLGVDAVFFPAGSSWQGPVTMYPRIWQKAASLTLADVMDDDLQQYRQANPSVAVEEGSSISISPSISGRVRYFKSATPELHEAVAYIDQSQTVAVLVLRATTEPRFKEALPAFEAFVRSYRALSLPSRRPA